MTPAVDALPLSRVRPSDLPAGDRRGLHAPRGAPPFDLAFVTHGDACQAGRHPTAPWPLPGSPRAAVSCAATAYRPYASRPTMQEIPRIRRHPFHPNRSSESSEVVHQTRVLGVLAEPLGRLLLPFGQVVLDAVRLFEPVSGRASLGAHSAVGGLVAQRVPLLPCQALGIGSPVRRRLVAATVARSSSSVRSARVCGSIGSTVCCSARVGPTRSSVRSSASPLKALLNLSSAEWPM